jgi:nucleotide-binding universal stress UspA family protein
MKIIERILFPTDYSPFSNDTIEYAIAFALEYKARLYIMHVVELSTKDPADPMYKKPDLTDYTDVHNFIKGSTARQLKGARISSKKFEYKEIHKMGLSASREIVKAARKKKVDLIVMASLGAGFLKKLLLGSTTERVIKEASCPVLVTRKGARSFVDFKSDKIRIRRILCPVDFSACSIRVVRAASDFAKRFGAEIFLLHVIDEHSQKLDFFIEHFKRGELDKKLQVAGEKQLEVVAGKYLGKKIKHNLSVVIGNSKKDITAFAKKNKADLIILGAYGRGEKDCRDFSGSVLLKVVKGTDCPVLIIR